MFFSRKHDALLSRLEEKIQTLEQDVAAQKAQLGTQLEDVSQNIAKLQTSVHKQDMAVEDLIEEWNDRQSDVEQVKEKFRAYAQNERQLLELFEAYQEHFWNLKRFAEEKNESLVAQLALMEKKLEHYRQLCGISIIGECGIEVDYDLYEVLEAVETEDADKDRTVVCVYRCGYLYKGKVIKKAQAAVYRYLAK